MAPQDHKVVPRYAPQDHKVVPRYAPQDNSSQPLKPSSSLREPMNDSPRHYHFIVILHLQIKYYLTKPTQIFPSQHDEFLEKFRSTRKKRMTSTSSRLAMSATPLELQKSIHYLATKLPGITTGSLNKDMVEKIQSLTPTAAVWAHNMLKIAVESPDDLKPGQADSIIILNEIVKLANTEPHASATKKVFNKIFENALKPRRDAPDATTGSPSKKTSTPTHSLDTPRPLSGMEIDEKSGKDTRPQDDQPHPEKKKTGEEKTKQDHKITRTPLKQLYRSASQHQRKETDAKRHQERQRQLLEINNEVSPQAIAAKAARDIQALSDAGLADPLTVVRVQAIAAVNLERTVALYDNDTEVQRRVKMTIEGRTSLAALPRYRLTVRARNKSCLSTVADCLRLLEVPSAHIGYIPYRDNCHIVTAAFANKERRATVKEHLNRLPGQPVAEIDEELANTDEYEFFRTVVVHAETLRDAENLLDAASHVDDRSAYPYYALQPSPKDSTKLTFFAIAATECAAQHMSRPRPDGKKSAVALSYLEDDARKLCLTQVPSNLREPQVLEQLKRVPVRDDTCLGDRVRYIHCPRVSGIVLRCARLTRYTKLPHRHRCHLAQRSHKHLRTRQQKTEGTEQMNDAWPVAATSAPYEIRVMAWNVNGLLVKKIDLLKQTLLQINPDIIFLAETGQLDCEKDTLWLRNQFPKHIVTINSPKFKPRVSKGYGSVMLINANLAHAIDIHKEDDKRSISINLRDTNCWLHAMYAPANDKEKDEFWSKWERKLYTSSTESCGRVIIGDLNQIIEPRDSSSGKSNTASGFRAILTSFEDVWRRDHHDTTEMTFRKVLQESNEAYESRIDLTLARGRSINVRAWVESGKTPSATNLFTSGLTDHKPIMCAITSPKAREPVTKSPLVNPYERSLQLRNNEAWEYFVHDIGKELPTIQEIDSLSANDLSILLEQKIRELLNRNFSYRKRIVYPKVTLGLRIQLKRATKALTVIPYLRSRWSEYIEYLPKAILKLRYNESKFQTENPTHVNQLDDWRKNIAKAIQDIRKEIKKVEDKMKRDALTDILKRKRRCAFERSSEFFKSALPNKMKRHSLTTNVKLPNGDITGDPEKVKVAVAEAMKEVLLTKGLKPDADIPRWAKTARAEKARTGMRPLMHTLTQPITIDEVSDVIKRSGNKVSLPLDGVPNIVYRKARIPLAPYLTKLFNKIYCERQPIPDTWRENLTVLLPKESDTTDPLTSRPIAMLSCAYKIFTGVLNQRLTKILEEGEFFGPSQAGWRKGRSTFNKILSLVNTMEIKRAVKQDLNVLWLDLSKFFNSIERWALDEIFEILGFPQPFRDTVKDIFTRNTTHFRTAYGNTAPCEETRGTRQGDTISSTFGLIYLEPLLWTLEEEKITATLKENLEVPPQAFGDDLTIVTDTPHQVQKGIEIVAAYCNRTNTEIGIKGKAKTAWASTNPTDLEISLTDRQGTRTRTVPKLARGETYRYLGILLDIEGNLVPIESDIVKTVNYFVSNLRRNYMTSKMKVDIITKVLYPAILYRAVVAPLSRGKISVIKEKINYILYSTMNLDASRNSIKHLQAPPSLGGFGLPPFESYYKREIVATWIESGLNSRDLTTSKLCAMAMTLNTRLAECVRQSAIDLHTKIIPTPHHEEAPHLLYNFFREKTTKALSDYGITRTQHLFDNDARILPDRKIRENVIPKTRFPIGKAKWRDFRVALEEEYNPIQRDRVRATTLGGRHRMANVIHANREDGHVLICIDGSQRAARTGIGLAWNAKGQIEAIFIRALGLFKVDEADLAGVIVTLQESPIDTKILIADDNRNVVELVEEVMRARGYKSACQKRYDLKVLLVTLWKEIKRRTTGSVRIRHVHSTLHRWINKDPSDHPLEIRKDIQTWGPLATVVAKGNKAAHNAAKKALTNEFGETLKLRYEAAGDYILFSPKEKALISGSTRGFLTRSIAQSWEEEYANENPRMLITAADEKSLTKIMTNNDPSIGGLQNFIFKERHSKLLTEQKTTEINKSRRLAPPAYEVANWQAPGRILLRLATPLAWDTSRKNLNKYCCLCANRDPPSHQVEDDIHWKSCPHNEYDKSEIWPQLREIIQFYRTVTTTLVTRDGIPLSTQTQRSAPGLMLSELEKLLQKLSSPPNTSPIPTLPISDTAPPTERVLWRRLEAIIDQIMLTNRSSVGVGTAAGLRSFLCDINLRVECITPAALEITLCTFNHLRKQWNWRCKRRVTLRQGADASPESQPGAEEPPSSQRVEPNDSGRDTSRHTQNQTNASS